MPRNYDVIVVEDEPKILKNLVEKVQASPRLRVVASASHGREAIELLESLRPQVLLTDIRMPILDGLALIAWVNTHQPGVKVVILTGYDDFHYAQQAIKLNVFDFLLKPVSSETLKTMLDRLVASLDEAYGALEHRALHRWVSGQTPHGAPGDAFAEKEEFLPFLITLGNLREGFVSHQQVTRYQTLWSGVSFAGWQAWVLEEAAPNQRLLILQGTSSRNHTSTARELKDLVAGLLPAVAVTVCFHPVPVRSDRLYETVQGLRAQLRDGLVPFVSQLISEASPPAEVPSPASSPLVLTYLRSGSRLAFKNELNAFLKAAREKSLPQQKIERALIDLLVAFDLHWGGDEAVGRPQETIDAIFEATDREDWRQRIDDAFDRRFTLADREARSSSQLVNEITEYLAQNFADPLSFDQIARKFNISPSYLTRAFKKMRQETPVKCLINLRINEAKRLIATKPDLELKDVAAIVGYPDQHYFSRIFRNVTGMSPSEFRTATPSTPSAG